MHPNEALAAATGSHQWDAMGSQQSVMEGADRHPGSRSPSPLPGQDGDAYMEAQQARQSPRSSSERGRDGLPTEYQFSSTMPEAPMGFGDVDQPVFASQQPESTKKTKKKRKDANRKNGSEITANAVDQQDIKNEENDGLADSGRDVKSEPVSPDAQKKKKKKSRKSTTRTDEPEESQQAPEGSEELPVLHTQLESQVLGTEQGHTRLQNVDADLQPTPELSTTRKTRRKSRKPADRESLELGEDPIAGSDEDDIIPSSARASERRRSVHGSPPDGARKFRQPEKLSALSGDAIQDDVEPQLSGDLIASTQAQGSPGSLGTNALVGEDSFLAGQDVSSPLLAREDRRYQSTSRPSSVALRETLSPQAQTHGINPIPVADMDLDSNTNPVLNGMVNANPQPSQHSQILGENGQANAMGGDDDAMGEEVTQSTQEITLEDYNLASQTNNHAMVADAGTQEDTAADGAEDNTWTKNGATDSINNEHGQATVSSASTAGGITKKAKKASSRKSKARKGVQRKSPEIDHVSDNVASNAAPASAANGEDEQPERAEDEAEEQRRFNAEFVSDPGDDKQPNTPARSAPSPVMASGRVTRSYKKRQPKPTFYEREEQQNAAAFAELPPDEAADPPKSRARPKRRLQVSGEETEAAPKAKTQRKAKKVKTDPEVEDDEEGNTTLGGGRYAQGPLTAEENAILDKVVQEFREEHNMTQYEVNELMKQNTREPLPNELWNRLDEACTTRKRQKIINVCRQRFHNFVARGTWTQEQDDELMEQIKQYGQKWSIIGRNINRHQKDVRDRWRNFLICRGKIVESHWSPEEESRFLDIVLEALRIFGEQRKAHPDIFGNKTNEQLVDWGIISERMGHSRTRLQCQEKWRRLRAAHKLDERFADQLPEWVPYGASWRHDKARKELRQFTHDDKYKLVCAISEADVRSDAKIPWSKVEKRMGVKGQIERVTLMIMWSRLRAAVPDQENRSTTQCAEYLVETYESEGALPTNIGNEELDADKEEQMINDHVAAAEGKQGKSGSTGRRKSTQSRRSFPKSDALIQESDVEGDNEPGKDDNAGQADIDLALQSLGEGVNVGDKPSGEDTDMQDADHVSVDLADNPGLHGPGEADMAIDPALNDIYDPIVAHEEPTPTAKPKRGKKSVVGELSGGQASPATKRSKKRNNVEVNGIQSEVNGSPKASRKRMRIDNIIDPSSPDNARKRARRTQKAMPPGEALIDSKGQADASSDIDEDMDDIPARMPIATLIN